MVSAGERGPDDNVEGHLPFGAARRAPTTVEAGDTLRLDVAHPQVIGEVAPIVLEQREVEAVISEERLDLMEGAGMALVPGFGATEQRVEHGFVSLAVARQVVE